MPSHSPARQRFNDWFNQHLTRVPAVQKILFVYHLYIMIKAGLSLVAALKILTEQITNPRLKATVASVKAQVEKGEQLSAALSLHPQIFPAVYVSMIAAGETAGKLEDALQQVASQMKKNHELTGRVRGAMIYPAVIMVAMIGIGIEMVVFVLPKIVVMFEDINAELPLATRLLIGVVRGTQQYGLFILLGLAALIIGAMLLYRRVPVKRAVHRFNLHLPIFGPIIKKINLARFTLTLGSLLKSTILIIEAVQICAKVVGNLMYREALLQIAEALKKGEALSKGMAEAGRLFPPMVVQMVMVGEETGQIEPMLGELSEYYSSEVDTTMKNFSTVIEPVIILLLGLGVAGIAVAVIMPIYSLAQNF